MEVFEFIKHTSNTPYFFTSCLVIGLMIIEVAGFISGMDAFGSIDEMLPDFDLDIDVDAPGFHPLAWLNFGKVPILISLLSFLMIFSLLGYGIQWYTYQYFGTLFPSVFSIGVFLLSILPVKYVNKGMSKIIPQDETSAVERSSFEGELAVIVSPICNSNEPAQAKLKDEYGTTHYIQVVPEDLEEVFTQDETVLLFKEKGYNFSCIRWTNS